MMKNRKATVSSILKVLILLIVLVVSAFFIMYFEIYAGEQAKQKVNPCLCRLSVDRVEATKILETPSAFGIDCDTRFVNIYYAEKEKKIEKGERIDYYVSNSTQLKDALAHEILLGWWQMGEGLKNPYPNLVTLTSGRNSRCVITSQVYVDQSAIDAYGITITDFEDYLKNYQFSECGVKKTGLELLGDKMSFDRLDLTRDGAPITLSVFWVGTVTPDLKAARTVIDLGKIAFIVGEALKFVPGINVFGPSVSLLGAGGVVGGIAYNVATIKDEAYLFAIGVAPADTLGKQCGQLY